MAAGDAGEGVGVAAEGDGVAEGHLQKSVDSKKGDEWLRGRCPGRIR